MFIVIEYGEGENLLVNPDCSAISFMDYVKKHCGLSPKDNIDVCDDSAQMFEIYNKDRNENMFDYFIPRNTYLLLKTDLNADGSVQKVTPMMSEWEKKYQFLERKLKIRERRARQAASTVSDNSKNLNDSKLGLGISKKRELSTSRTDSRRESSVLKEETVPTKKSTGGRTKKK